MTQILRGTVTSKGQITLPKAVRDLLRATQGTELEFVLEGDQVTVRKAHASDDPLQAWFGIAPLEKGQSVNDWIRELREDSPDTRPDLENSPEQPIIYLSAPARENR